MKRLMIDKVSGKVAGAFALFVGFLGMREERLTGTLFNPAAKMNCLGK
jgi:hypothetical protein